MPRERAPEASLADMLDAAESALEHVAGKTRQDYEDQKLLRDAVERRIEIIGEAARRLISRRPPGDTLAHHHGNPAHPRA
jgi:uncharacterized protein with HEPN domain